MTNDLDETWKQKEILRHQLEKLQFQYELREKDIQGFLARIATLERLLLNAIVERDSR